MSSKLLKFEQTQTTARNAVNDLSGMSDIAFDTTMGAESLVMDIPLLTPEDGILQSLKNLMSLPVGGNVLFPTRGERVGDMLFAPGLSQSEAQTYIVSYLNSNEPRINILNVSSSKYINDYNEQIVTLNVAYSFKNSEEIHNAIVELKTSANVSQI